MCAVVDFAIQHLKWPVDKIVVYGVHVHVYGCIHMCSVCVCVRSCGYECYMQELWFVVVIAACLSSGIFNTGFFLAMLLRGFVDFIL